MTALDPSTTEDIARQRRIASDNSDTNALRELYSPDIVIWHNTDQIEQSLEDNLKSAAWFARRLPDKHVDDVRLLTTPRGYLEQYVIRGTAADGTKVEIPACLIVTIDGGKITRLEEYLDTAHVAPLMKRPDKSSV
jgi:ketosteroid isomerase-like protein